jgi:hypothetical protein
MCREEDRTGLNTAPCGTPRRKRYVRRAITVDHHTLFSSADVGTKPIESHPQNTEVDRESIN